MKNFNLVHYLPLPLKRKMKALVNSVDIVEIVLKKYKL